jgi:hypothetical protein
MKTWIALPILTAAASFACASAAFAGPVGPPTVGAPAPLLGAGLPGLAIIAVTGAGYLAIRLRRRGRD